MTGLAVGPHELRVQATDRFGLTETTPAVLRFKVDMTLPRTIALVRLASDVDRRATLSMGSDKPGAFLCTYIDQQALAAFGDMPFEDFSYFPCKPGLQIERGWALRVRAVDEAGNRDPTPITIHVPRLGEGFQGPESSLPTFAGARAEVGISGRLPVDPAAPYGCRHDGGAWAPCSFTFRMPIQHAGRHTLQARQRQPDGGYLTTRELATTVSASDRNTTIVGLQMTLVLERSAALARRSPRVRFALNRPAVLRVDIMRGRKRLVKVVAKGVVGANTIKLPTRKLRSLPTGRYGLVIVARGTSGPVADQRLPLALVRPLG